MDVYQRAVSCSIKNYMALARRSADHIALHLHITRGTFYAKLSNHRRWTLEDIANLESLGVKLPPLSLGRAAK